MYIVIKPKLWYTTFYSTTGRKYHLTCETYLPETEPLDVSIQPVAIREYGKAGSEVLVAHYANGSQQTFNNIHDVAKAASGSIVNWTTADEYGIN